MHQQRCSPASAPQTNSCPHPLQRLGLASAGGEKLKVISAMIQVMEIEEAPCYR